MDCSVISCISKCLRHFIIQTASHVCASNKLTKQKSKITWLWRMVVTLNLTRGVDVGMHISIPLCEILQLSITKRDLLFLFHNVGNRLESSTYETFSQCFNSNMTLSCSSSWYNTRCYVFDSNSFRAVMFSCSWQLLILNISNLVRALQSTSVTQRYFQTHGIC